MLRRVTGQSMAPALRPGKMVVGVRLFWRLAPGDTVIIRHEGLDKLKRVAGVRAGQVFVLGDNPGASTDSRHFGWLPQSVVVAKLLWSRPGAGRTGTGSTV